MIIFLGNANPTSSILQVPAFWIFLCLIIVSIASFVYINIRQYKFKKACKAVQENLKLGDYVKTFSGLLGKVVGIADVGNMRVVTLKNLDKVAGNITVDIQAICSLLDE